MFEDPHIAFIRVIGPDGAMVAERVRDRKGHASFLRSLRDCNDGAVCEACARVEIRGENRHEGLAANIVLWDAQGEPAGVASLGIIDPAYPEARHHLARLAIVAGLAVCALATPFVAMGARRLALPLRRLASAAERLADGESPEPIPLDGPPRDRLRRTPSTAWRPRSKGQQRHPRDQRRPPRPRRGCTAELNRLNERLRVELAERAQFFRTISHDLGAPLRNTAGMLALLRRKHADALPPDAIERLEHIAANITLELDMIRDLLEVSRVGVVEERPERVDAEEGVSEIRAAFDHDLRSKRIEFAVHRPLPALHLERARFRQVLQNLIDNAIKYMGDSKRRAIDVVAWVDEDGATFCVADTGPGIPHAEHETIFDMFRRFRPRRRRSRARASA